MFLMLFVAAELYWFATNRFRLHRRESQTFACSSASCLDILSIGNVKLLDGAT
jgi:hypothetical protein